MMGGRQLFVIVVNLVEFIQFFLSLAIPLHSMQPERIAHYGQTSDLIRTMSCKERDKV